MRKILCALLGIIGMFITPAHALPTGYTQLEYIESTGTQYIDTRFIANQDTRIESQIYATAEGCWIYGSGSSEPRITAYLSSTGNQRFGNALVYNTGIRANTLITIVQDKNSFNWNNNVAVYGSQDNFVTNRSITIGTSDGSSTVPLFSGKFYYMKIYDNGTLVRNFVPAKNASGVVGMYDTVGNQFYTNSGTGEFIAGPVLAPCRNLFDANVVLGGTMSSNDGADGVPNTARAKLEYLYLSAGTYTISNNGNTINQVIGASYSDDAGSNFSPIDVWNWHDLPFTFTLTSNRHVRFMVRNSSNVDLTNDNIGKFQLEEGDTATEYVPYCVTDIKVATTKYTETVFNPLNTALANAVATVNTVVTNTINQAASIATLQSGKQTRPADDTCPAYKQCLLVEDENGTPHWYQITDPFRDFVAPIVGANISPIEESAFYDAGYQQLEYIESTGTQYIDTGVVGNMGIAAEIKLSISDAKTSWILGSRTSQEKRFGAIILSDTWDFGLNTDNTFGQYVVERDYVINFVTNLNTPSTMSINNGNSIAVSEVNNTDLQLYLFNVNYNGTPTSGQGFIGKIYYSKIWNNGTLVRNFVPVRKNEYGTIGMYDTVNGVFYTNQGTGSFVAGPVVENDANVPAPQWRRDWNANSQYNLSAGEVYGTARCNNLSGTQEHAQTATSAQVSSSGWLENGAKCWCKVVGINVDNEYIEAPATAPWVFDSVRPSVADCNKMCAAACSNRTLGEPAFRKALFGM